MVLAVNRIAFEVTQRVMHPAHVPFHAKPQAADVRAPRNLRPGGRFLGDSHHVREAAIDLGIELAQKSNRFQVLAATVMIWNPFTGLAGIVEVKHRGHSIEPQSVHVIFVEPEQRAADEETADFIAAVVEDRASPIGVKALPRVGMLEQMCAIKVGQSVSVGGKMRRHQSRITPMPF